MFMVLLTYSHPVWYAKITEFIFSPLDDYIRFSDYEGLINLPCKLSLNILKLEIVYHYNNFESFYIQYKTYFVFGMIDIF